ncbi:hypothetical protein ABL840_26710 [Variovorax sp. NFACC27]|uniref:hypothetical protein n=1 Tax=unclassified Variovorax TaxID=663243 RepID=UPI0008965266|nr:X-X-X-Leu-X-X-Gly heptad repeat-containing protein [Variovorax sp. NFACC28]SEG78193.1 X-X-X-Leu-X-X-Gly heptad repeat-containing protein [Variovorax sp. NFACC29]SFC95647.1 X-X-X-Leu-X-X-Gly heptad repeat-containing protein [Variovorax sp. NFACC26]SFG08819.1 X-X-X-Leu-X-X-Gly heptad repeat-containing protein [Variovorax sp. NFACC27]
MTKVAFNTLLVTSASASTVDDFKRVCQELHDKLLEAGLVAGTDTGQLDFSAITTLTSNTNYGYRIYKLNDGNTLPIFLKIRFVTPAQTTTTRLLWSFYLSIGLGTNGAGTLTSATPEYVAGANQSSGQYQRNATFGQALQSYICVLPGFLGVSFKQLAIDPSTSYGPSAAVADSPPLASFFICRDTNDSGEPTAEGASLIVVAPGGTYNGYFGDAPIAAYLSKTGVVTVSSRCALALGAENVATVDGKIPIYNFHTMTPAPKRLAQLLCVRRGPGAVGNDEFTAAAVGTQTRNFMAMNPVWPGDVFNGTSVRAAVAMLWE